MSTTATRQRIGQLEHSVNALQKQLQEAVNTGAQRAQEICTSLNAHEATIKQDLAPRVAALETRATRPQPAQPAAPGDHVRHRKTKVLGVVLHLLSRNRVTVRWDGAKNGQIHEGHELRVVARRRVL